MNPALTSLMHNTDYDSEFSLEGDGTGIGYNVGVIIRPIEYYQFGISYRGAMDVEYEGKAVIADITTAQRFDLTVLDRGKIRRRVTAGAR